MRTLLAAMTGLALCASAQAAETPLQAADAFYAVYATFQPSDGIPDRAGRAKYDAVVSPALAALLQRAGTAEEAFHKANKDAPPLVEGDLFTSLFEGAGSYRVGACRLEEKQAFCPVELAAKDGKGKALHWSDTVYLAQTSSGWRVDDIGYGGNWAFANKGRLTQTLQQIVSMAGE